VRPLHPALRRRRPVSTPPWSASPSNGPCCTPRSVRCAPRPS